MAADAEAAAPRLRAFETEADLELISGLISAELSEPYTVFTYRYFIWAWPNLTYLAYLGGKCVGCVVGKAERQSGFLRGYIAMLVVEKSSRGRGIGTLLAERLIRQMVADGCDLIALEAEVTNAGALAVSAQGTGAVRGLTRGAPAV